MGNVNVNECEIFAGQLVEVHCDMTRYTVLQIENLNSACASRRPLSALGKGHGWSGILVIFVQF